MGVGWVALMEKNFESSKTHDSSGGDIPFLWFGRLDRVSALLKASDLWIMEKWKWERKRDQWAWQWDSCCFV